LIYAAIASWFLIVPADSAIATSGVDRKTYELTQLIPLGVIILMTVVFYIWGQSEKANKDVLVELNVEAPISAEVVVAQE
jgi:glutamate:GABA antiporter